MVNRDKSTNEKITARRKKANPDADFENDDISSKNVECICPKCGAKHFMNFRWIGRGTPRKYCPECKGNM